VNWLMEDLARINPARVETPLDRAMLTFRCLQARRIIAPTVFERPRVAEHSVCIQWPHESGRRSLQVRVTS
jgi:hypothetical protein